MADRSSARAGAERASCGHEESEGMLCARASGPRNPGPFGEMPRGMPIEIGVIEIWGRGTRPLGPSVGDLLRSDQVGAVCDWAGYTFPPRIPAVRFGGEVPWEAEPGLARVCWPDPEDVVVCEVRRRSPGRPMLPGA